MRYLLAFILLGVSTALFAERLPGWFIPLREAVYEQQLSSDEIKKIYDKVKDSAKKELSGVERDVILARCEYFMGRVFQENKRNTEAILCYEQSITFAEKSLKTQKTTGAYEMIAGCIGQLCTLRPTGWVMANGLRVEQNARKALDADPANAQASYFIASRWVFGPGVLGDPKRGLMEMQNILDGPFNKEKDDYFNAYSALGYGYIRLKKYDEARVWVQKALEIYPTNKYAGEMLAKIQKAAK